MAGRKPKPTAVKKLEGNPGKRKLNTKEPVPAKGMPDCPEWLLPEAKKEWERLADLMNQMGILTEVDMAAFAAYCQSYARWKEAQEHIDSEGSTFETDKGYQQQTPWVGIANTNQKLMLQAASEFGLTPSSRSRIVAGNPVLRWMAGNVVIDTDPAGNIKVTKAKSKEKIDGIVAAIMVLDRCIRQEGQSGSVYDERGLLVF